MPQHAARPSATTRPVFAALGLLTLLALPGGPAQAQGPGGPPPGGFGGGPGVPPPDGFGHGPGQPPPDGFGHGGLASRADLRPHKPVMTKAHTHRLMHTRKVSSARAAQSHKAKS